ncbi:MAG: Fe-S cluster assembly protein HesB, partial [Xanthomonadales bacterium]|nr:Fe-S cluster assembly protein HesB [Xanthomonadales bacterium]
NRLLATDPLALLIGMLLDQQFPMERAFLGPYLLRERLGRELDAGEIAAADPAVLEDIFKGPPAIHRFPGSMA